MTPRAIQLHIERVVLHGLAHVDRTALADALYRELEARLIEAPPTLDVGGAVDRLTTPPLPAVASADSTQLGTALAAALHGALSDDTGTRASREGSDGTNPRP